MPRPLQPRHQRQAGGVDALSGVIDYSYELFQGPVDAAEEIILDVVYTAVERSEAHRQARDDAVEEAILTSVHTAVYGGDATCRGAQSRGLAERRAGPSA